MEWSYKAKAIRIIHMSDIHLVKDGAKIWDTDTKSHFNKALKKISHIKDIDAIFVSGDLSDDGSLWTYQYIDESFKSLGIPTYCCPGNHDNLEVMMKTYSPKFYKVQECVSLKGWKFHLLNTVVDGMSRGILPESVIENIEYDLKGSNSPRVFVLHHPPIEPGGWFNRKLLENRNDLNAVLFKYPNVRLVLFGHIHYHLNRKIDNIIFSSSSSIGFAFDMNLPKFQIADGNEGFSLIDIVENSINIENILI